jgi:PIN domain nuclease of toxin-antitoxin system
MRVLLDTQTLVDAYLGNPLPLKIQNLLADPDTERLVSAVSIMEIAIKSGRKKLSMSDSNTQEALTDLQTTLIPFTTQHAYRLFPLPWHHKDPWDRLLIATALTENIPLIGRDKQFKQYEGLNLIWG